MYKLTNLSKKCLIATEVKIADTFFSRAKGLLGRASLNEQEALVIRHCNSIHMFFMRFPIDVVFLDKRQCVVGLIQNIKPGQLSPIFFKAKSAVELPSGTISRKNIQMNDLLEIIKD